MRRTIRFVAIFALLTIGSLLIMGAAPAQRGVPPSPYNADYFSGTVYLDAALAPAGTQIIACVDDCSVFQTGIMTIDGDGAYNLLAIHPDDENLRGRRVTFHIVNEHGKIAAEEITYFEGGFNAMQLDLHFQGPLPTPPLPPTLPNVGDPILPLLPRFALVAGAFLLTCGLLLLIVGRRRVTGTVSRV